MKILVMGLPGSGKTWLAKKLANHLDAAWLNADHIRKMANDWDFSETGRIRQAERMFHYATFESVRGRTVIADFICPTPKTRHIFGADLIIWMDTINTSRYEDTNKIFIPLYDDETVHKIRFTNWPNDDKIEDIAKYIKKEFNV